MLDDVPPLTGLQADSELAAQIQDEVCLQKMCLAVGLAEAGGRGGVWLGGAVIVVHVLPIVPVQIKKKLLAEYSYAGTVETMSSVLPV